MAKDPCAGCVYWAKTGSGETHYCSYLLRTDKMRPCPPGEGCTVKEPIKRKRRTKKEPQNNG